MTLDYIQMVVVAPHAGALVETVEAQLAFQKQAVAPHAGALVETYTERTGLHRRRRASRRRVS